MKATKPTQKLLFLIFTASVIVLTLDLPITADVVGIQSIGIDPPQPTDLNPIEITTYGGISYIFDIEFVSSHFQISGTSIDLDYYFLDTNPGGMRLPVAGDWDSTEYIGTLPQATYYVTSRAWVTDYLFSPDYRLADTHSTSFSVIPEPTTFMLLGFGGLMLRKKRRM